MPMKNKPGSTDDNEMMAGRNIRQKDDPLQKVEVSRLFAAVKNPKPHIQSLIKQLRTILTIDENRYRQLKVHLPYVVCGNFHPPYRRTEHFGFIRHFIVDIDHLAEKEMDINVLKQKLQSDDQVEMVFNSPGNDGLKVFFKLKEKCYDPAQFSLFYKVFAREFSEKYQLSQVVDTSTSDVTRACFVSWDPGAYYNPESSAVPMEDYINFEDHHAVKKLQQQLKVPNGKTPQGNSVKQPLTEDLLEAIKSRLKPERRSKPAKIIHTPKALEPIGLSVTRKVNEFDIQVRDILNIHYGKKFIFTYGAGSWTEINIFYGKKGFTIVRSPKRGRDENLEEVVFQILCDLFYSIPEIAPVPPHGKSVSDPNI